MNGALWFYAQPGFHSYDAWKLASPDEGERMEVAEDGDERADFDSLVDAGPWGDDESTEVDEPDAWTLAAMSGEGGNVDEKQQPEQEPPTTPGVLYDFDFIKGRETTWLVALRNAIELELRTCVETHERKAREARIALIPTKEPKRTRRGRKTEAA